MTGLANIGTAVTSRGLAVITGTLTRGFQTTQVTRAFEATDGTESWVHRVPMGLDAPAAASVVNFGQKLWIVGGSKDRLVVTGLSSFGTLEWQEINEPGVGVIDERVEVGAYTSAGRRLFVAGSRSRLSDDSTSVAAVPMVARRYDIGRGNVGELVWETEVGDGAFRARGISIGFGLVLVVGETIQATTERPRWTVYALREDTGEVVWSDMPFPARRASSTAAAVFRTTVVGSVSRARQIPVIRSYDPFTGELRWQRRGTAGRRGRFEDIAPGLVVSGSGRQRGDRGDRAVVQVFDAEDGTLIDTRFGPSGASGAVLSALASGGRLIVAGGRIDGPGESSKGLLHMYQVSAR